MSNAILQKGSISGVTLPNFARERTNERRTAVVRVDTTLLLVVLHYAVLAAHQTDKLRGSSGGTSAGPRWDPDSLALESERAELG